MPKLMAKGLDDSDGWMKEAAGMQKNKSDPRMRSHVAFFF